MTRFLAVFLPWLLFVLLSGAVSGAGLGTFSPLVAGVCSVFAAVCTCPLLLYGFPAEARQRS